MSQLRRYRPQKNGDEYRRIWRIVDGAIRDAIAAHPEYFPNRKRLAQVRTSLAKRVAGSVLGWAEQSARGRSGKCRRLTTDGRFTTTPSDAVAGLGVAIRDGSEAGALPGAPAESSQAGGGAP